MSVLDDDEHNAYSLDVEDRQHGYPRLFHFGVEFVSSGEYRTLAAAIPRDCRTGQVPGRRGGRLERPPPTRSRTRQADATTTRRAQRA